MAERSALAVPDPHGVDQHLGPARHLQHLTEAEVTGGVVAVGKQQQGFPAMASAADFFQRLGQRVVEPGGGTGASRCTTRLNRSRFPVKSSLSFTILAKHIRKTSSSGWMVLTKCSTASVAS